MVHIIYTILEIGNKHCQRKYVILIAPGPNALEHSKFNTTQQMKFKWQIWLHHNVTQTSAMKHNLTQSVHGNYLQGYQLHRDHYHIWCRHTFRCSIQFSNVILLVLHTNTFLQTCDIFDMWPQSAVFHSIQSHFKVTSTMVCKCKIYVLHSMAKKATYETVQDLWLQIEIQ